MKHFKEITTIEGIDDSVFVINQLIFVDGYYGAVFAADGTDSVWFIKYSIVLYDEKEGIEIARIDLIASRNNKTEPFTYDLKVNDSELFSDSTIKVGRALFEPVFNLYTSFLPVDINEFLKIAKRISSNFLNISDHWKIIEIPTKLIVHFYFNPQNRNLKLEEVVTYFYERKEIIDVIAKRGKELLLSNVYWYELPDELWELTYLQKLTIENTGIYNLPKEIENLSDICELIIAKNRCFETIPPEISKLKKLTHLYLYENNIKFLPESIGELENLKVLYLSNNRLRTLPKSLTMLPKLEIINLSYNPIKELPDDLFEMQSLKEINIKNCMNLNIDEIHTKLINNPNINIYS